MGDDRKGSASKREDVTREAVQAMMEQGMSLSAIARELRCSYQTVRSRVDDACLQGTRPARRGRKPMSTDEFIRRAREVHGDRYDYSKVRYARNDRKVCIICPEHGPFWQMPFKHLSGSGCSHPACANAKRMATNLSRYGAKAILQVDEFRAKRQRTVKARYGVNSVMQADAVKQRWRDSRKKGEGKKKKPTYQWPWDAGDYEDGSDAE